ncbi:type IV pilin protein [Persephonella sp.]
MIKSQKGFTLIELLIVVAIIAVLSSIALVSYMKYRQTAQKVVVKHDVKSLIFAIESFKVKYNQVPQGGSCGPGPADCNLVKSDGSASDITIHVNKDVVLQWEFNGKCADGIDKVSITGKHTAISGWEVSYNSCENRIK